MERVGDQVQAQIEHQLRAQTKSGEMGPINTDIRVDMSSLEAARKQVQQLRTDILHMPNLTNLTRQAVAETDRLGRHAQERLQHVNTPAFEKIDNPELYHRRTESVKSDFEARRKLLSSDTGLFSVQQQHSLFDGVNDSIRQALDKMVPTIADVYKTKTSAARIKKDSAPLGDVEEIVDEYLLKDKSIQAMLRPISKMAGYKSLPKDFMRNFMATTVARVAPAHELDPYSRERYGRSVKSTYNSPYDEDIHAYIPRSFHDAFDA